VGIGGPIAQRDHVPELPVRSSTADVLAGDAEGASDLGLGEAGDLFAVRLHADAFERLAVTRTAGVAAVGDWSHTAMLPAKPRSCHRDWRTSF